jgi:putative transposase
MNAIAKQGVQELRRVLDVDASCDALGLPRSSFYYQPIPVDEQRQRGGGKQPNELDDIERATIVERLNSDQLCDLSPRQAHATLLDEGRYLASPATFARLLKSRGQLHDRRPQRKSVARVVPMLCAVVPNDIWSWDTSPLASTVKKVFFHLYVILDIYSRFAVKWSVEPREDARLAEQLFQRACEDADAPGVIVHSDNGPIQRSNVIADCYSELGITSSYSRPHVSNDNPYSESLFKTAKYLPEYPQAFETIEQAQQWADETFTHYNYEHYHSGIGMLTPASVHFATHHEIIEQHCGRFRNGQPVAKQPKPAWINKPATTPTEMEEKQLN